MQNSLLLENFLEEKPEHTYFEKIFKKNIDMAPTREGYGDGQVLAGVADEKVVVLCADLTDSTKSALFKEKFPDIEFNKD